MWDKEWAWSKTFSETLLRQVIERRQAEQAFAAHFESDNPYVNTIPRRLSRVVGRVIKHFIQQN